MGQGCKLTIECLESLGCSRETAEQFFVLEQENRICEQIRLLNRERKNRMDDLHEAQKKVDCIDYIIRELEQKKKC